MNYLIPGLHYTDITRDRVCLVYALITSSELNIGAIIKSSMWKGVFEEHVDNMASLYLALVDITQAKGPDTEFVPILTTAERHRRDKLIMARMYGLEMLRHQNGCHASTDMQLGDIERRYWLRRGFLL
ncbi:hypothetical protein H5410_005046 [Solanum commersonii]|uniref:Uncharacterized protein n=1 Tax=Solanum commersonii TaxID=4109 RepID=A0A9J6A6I8_SOLCO|nr:hypothetical protein H5410_005046 [Solanum commersonii]